MSEEKKKSRAWIWGAVALLVLYPLSMGPMYWAFEKMGCFSDPSTVDRFGWIYGPIYWAAEQSEATNDALAWYLSLWGTSGPRPGGLGGGMF